MPDLDALRAVEVRLAAGETGREMDIHTIFALLAPPLSWIEQSKINGEWCIYIGWSARDPSRALLWEDSRSRIEPTTNLESAVMLVPNGWHWMVRCGADRGWYSVAYVAKPDTPVGDGSSGYFNSHIDGGTPAGALTLSIVRAHIALLENADA